MLGKKKKFANQRIIILEGCDKVGKSEIARAISKKYGIPYIKNTSEWSAGLRNPDYFVNTLRYAEPYFLSYLKQSGASVVLDRSYPSEWVYSEAFGRTTDHDALKFVDEEYSKLGAQIIVCHRSSYEGIKDDLFPDDIEEIKLSELDGLYTKFSSQTRCKTLRLNVDDENLSRELEDISLFLECQED
jgi:thymidylate kinase